MRITPIIASIFSLLLSLTAFGQPSPINRRAFALAGLAQPSGPDNPNNILPHMWYWWVASDLTNGVTVSNQFLDRIHSRPMNQMNNAVSPTNSALGVWFSGSTWLTNQNSPGDLGAPSPAVGFLVWRPMIQTGNAICIGSNDRGIGANATPSLQYTGNQSGGPNNISTLTASNLMDVIVYLTSTNTTWYTNGIPCKTNTTGSVDDIEVAAFGWTGNSSSFKKYVGYLVEWGMWSNAVASATIVDKLHKYATNTYGYTP